MIYTHSFLRHPDLNGVLSHFSLLDNGFNAFISLSDHNILILFTFRSSSTVWICQFLFCHPPTYYSAIGGEFSIAEIRSTRDISLSSQPALRQFKRGSDNRGSYNQVTGPPISFFLVGFVRPLSRSSTTSPVISHPCVISPARTERTRGRV